MNKTSAKSSLLLLLTASIWGVAFVAQSVGMDYIEPFTFNCIRNILGALTLLPVIFLGKSKAVSSSRTLFAGGIFCGILLFAASNFQQFGIQYTTVGKAGFITACYIVIVPILGLFLKKKCTPLIWLSVLFAVAGLYLLCITETFTLGKGDVLIFIGAFLFALHILVIDYFSPKVDGVRMSCIQFFLCGALSGICMLFTETPSVPSILSAGVPLLYAGILSCGVAYTLQIVGQKNMNPTVASLILSLESSISVLAGWLLLGQRLHAREAAGCVLMFLAILLAQLPAGLLKRRKQ